jgi:GNAT superfamily N-acetyltransferase
MTEFTIRRAGVEEIRAAFALVAEYYEIVGVVMREDVAQFESEYFAEDSGLWLACVAGEPVGCIGLRRLASDSNCGEIKRMYVRAAHRGCGIADSLLAALEKFAMDCGYQWLYLDTTDSMIAAARFYERNSYESCARYNENPQATLFMRKRLK